MNQLKTLALSLLLYLILLAPLRSTAASLFQPVRFLAEQVDAKPIQDMSPSPGPDSGVSKSIPKPVSGESKDDKNPAAAAETCEMVSNKCRYDVKNVTACVLRLAGSGTLGVLVLNDGDSSLKLNVTFIPSKSSNNDTEIPGHQVKKINVTSIASRSSSIVLSADNWTCSIQMNTGVPIPTGFPSYYTAYVTPVNGAYVLVATAVFIAGIWACCKLGKSDRHVDGGVQYQELEMGQQQLATTATADGWDQGWDDNWDEEKAVHSPSGNYNGGEKRSNGVSSTATASDTNGWENDWDD